MSLQSQNIHKANCIASTATSCSATTSQSRRSPQAEDQGAYALRASATLTDDAEPQPKPLTHYCIVRSDLPWGVICAQLLHAAGESSPGNLSEGTLAVVLDAKSEMVLLSVEKKLLARNIPHVAVREPDAPYCGQLMAIGIAPCDRSVVRKEVSNLPLLK